MREIQLKIQKMKKRYDDFLKSVPNPSTLSEDEFNLWKAKLSAIRDEMDHYINTWSGEFERRLNELQGQ